MIDNSKLSFSSEYAVDKVVRPYVGSFPVPATSSGSTVITHDLNKRCFTEMRWSTDNVAFQDAGLIVGTSGNEITAIQAADLNTASIYAGNLSGSPITIYYELDLIWPN